MGGSKYRKLIAEVVAALMRDSALNSRAKLARAATRRSNRKIGASTIGHLINADPDAPQPQLDTIVAVAEAFGLEPWMPLHPDFDPTTRAVGGTLSAEVIDLARRISGLSRDTQQMLLELLEHRPSDAPQREPLARVKELHEPARSDYKVRRSAKSR